MKHYQAITIATALLGTLAATAAADGALTFYTPRPNQEARHQIAKLTSAGETDAADSLRALMNTPQAVWIEQGTPKQAQQQARNESKRAAGKGTVPVFVIYNIPFRDCSQYSAGGATTVDEYQAWIDGVAAGIGDTEAVVIVEPDGLGIIPHYTTVEGVEEWCQPEEADAATAAEERFAMLNYAVDALGANENASVYLDGTHPGWLNVGDISDRLVKAGVERTAGFFLNASNYQFTSNSEQYGNWVAQCTGHLLGGGAATDCPNQYWNGGPEGTKIAELLGPWQGVALSSFGEWSDESNDPALNTSAINLRYEWLGAEPAAHFVIDTSRNGSGPWDASGLGLSDAQDWCNPPGRTLGFTPSAETGNELLDAWLWIKIPGESDGECGRGEAVDPVRGYVNPGAGEWFDEGALELVGH